MKSILLISVSLLAITSCQRVSGPPLEISNISVFAPLPGTSTAVSYMTVKNNTRTDIVISAIDSPQFELVELHETRIEDGIARMQKLGELVVPPQSTVLLEKGGKHLMLMSPRSVLTVNQPVELEFTYDGDGMLIFNTTIQSRIQNESTR